MSQRLDGFAQSHVVGEDASEIGAAEELQPVDAARLILAQRTMERVRNRSPEGSFRRPHAIACRERAASRRL